MVGCTTENPQNLIQDSILTQQKEQPNQTVIFADNLVQLQFPIDWNENENNNPFDLQYFSKDQKMNTGVFVYYSKYLSQNSTPQNIFKRQINDLKSKRTNFTIVEQESTETLQDKIITTAVYSGEKNESKYYYKFTLIEFTENSEQFLVTLQVSFPSQWNQNKPILEKITSSAKLNKF